jgi:hypothetical protein
MILAAFAVACALPALAQAPADRRQDEIRSFAQAHGVPSDGMADSGRGAARGGDPVLTQKAYALAYDAVRRRLVPKKQREVYESFVLPGLRAGCVAVVPVKDGSIAGAAATYDDVSDVIKIPDFEMSDVKQASRILHELVHVGQDAARLGQFRLAAEGEAYAAENEYVLRVKGVLQEQGDGAVAIHAGDITSMEATERLLIYIHAVENVENRRSDLNDFSDASTHGPDGAPIKGSSSPDTLAYLKNQVQTTQGLSDSLWSMATQFGAIAGGAVKDTGEFLQRDGLTHCAAK